MPPNSSIAIPGPSSKGKEEAEPEGAPVILERYSQALAKRSLQGSGATQNADKVLHGSTSTKASTSQELVLLADGEAILKATQSIEIRSYVASIEVTPAAIILKNGAVRIELTPAAIILKNGAASIELSPASVNINNGALEVI